MSFKIFLKQEELLNNFGAMSLPESFDWAKSIGSLLPNYDLDLPLIKKESKIDIIVDKKNPIYIQLADGTKLYFTLDEFRRINGKPEVGKNLLVTMQRLHNDSSNIPSKIISCAVTS